MFAFSVLLTIFSITDNTVNQIEGFVLLCLLIIFIDYFLKKSNDNVVADNLDDKLASTSTSKIIIWGFLIDENRAIAMGNYFFTDEKGNATKVEFTFGYKLVNSNLFIDLHHSSLPFSA